MTSIGQIDVLDDDGVTPFLTLEFYNMEFPGNGHPILVAVSQLDPINAMGVNFTRQRIIRLDASIFPLVGFTDYIDYDGAVTEQDQIRAFKGKTATLTFVQAGVLYTPANKFVILESLVEAMAGEVVSPNQVSAGDPPQAVNKTSLSMQWTGL